MSGARDAVGHTTVIADGGYRGTGLVIPHRRAQILRDCRLKGDGVHHAMLGIARLHNLTLAG
ncbi:hypothetical protein SUDANB105_07668 [Streptomyces sp. enrichment culture]